MYLILFILTFSLIFLTHTLFIFVYAFLKMNFCLNWSILSGYFGFKSDVVKINNNFILF